MTELRLIRTLDRIEYLKENGRWSFRQPKKQRNIGSLYKTHWDYLLDEMVCMSYFSLPSIVAQSYAEVDEDRLSRRKKMEDSASI